MCLFLEEMNFAQATFNLFCYMLLAYYVGESLLGKFLVVKLPYEPVCLSGSRLVDWSIIIS